MSHEVPERDGSLTTDLTRAATTAGSAPSVHNSQPWRWRVLPDRLELSAVRHRQLSATDPEGRLLMISCGAALHHARLALAAAGRATRVERLPDAAQPDLLARLIPVDERQPAPDEAVRLAACVPLRHTDRRAVAEEPVPAAILDALVRAASAEGTRCQILDSDRVLELAAAASRAAEEESDDPQIREELAYWTGRYRPTGAGLPAGVLPDRAAPTTVPARDFGAPGTLPVGPGHDRAATYALFYGDGDEPIDWLRAGEALSAAWLTATAHGVSTMPLSAVVEVPDTRTALRRVLSGLGYPYLVVRWGMPPSTPAAPPHTPRLASAQLVDTSAVADG